MGIIKTIIGDVVDEAKRNAKYEARRAGRRTIGKWVGDMKKSAAKKIKPMVDDFVAKHPTKKKLEEQQEVLDVAEAEAEALIEEVVQKVAIGKPVEVEEQVRRLELD